MRTLIDRLWWSLDRVPTPARWCAVVGWATVIFVLSAQPGLRVSDDPGVDLPTRHLAHIAAYALLTLLLGWALAGRRRPTGRAITLAAVGALLYGVTDEWHQTFVPSRTGRVEDLVWDGIGVLLAAMLLTLVARTEDRPT
ncbi:MAG: VanZ family protein [Chloroflexi bacterium]|nr:VanZ family protein [Chloroflexota bacterium]